MDEVNFINKVNFNLNLNKKSNKIDDYIKGLLFKKILPRIDKKMAEYKGSVPLVIDKMELNLSSITVQNINQITEAEATKLVELFMREFDAKLNEAIVQKKSESRLETLKTYLKNGYIINLKKTSLKEIFNQLSFQELKLLNHFFKTIENKEQAFIRFNNLIDEKQINKFITTIFPDYPRIKTKINQLFQENRFFLKISKNQFTYLTHEFFIYQTLKNNSSDELILRSFYENQLGLNPDLFLYNDKYLQINDFEQRRTIAKTIYEDYELALNKLIELLREEMNDLEYSFKELESSFLDFIIYSNNEFSTTTKTIKLYLDSKWLKELKKSISFIKKIPDKSSIIYNNELIHFLNYFIKNDSVPTSYGHYKENDILKIIISIAQENPNELRKAYLLKSNSILWNLSKSFSVKQLYKILNSLSLNFQKEQQSFFEFLQKLKFENYLTTSNIEELKREFFMYGLKNIISNKALFFKADKSFFLRWINDDSIQKTASFDKEKLQYKKTPTIDVFLEALILEKDSINKESKKETPIISEVNETDELPINFYQNAISHFLIYGEIPWWVRMQLDFSSEDVNHQILELVSQFKIISKLDYLNFLKRIKTSEKLLKRLVYNTNQSVFNTILIDFFPSAIYSKLNSFLRDLIKIVNHLYGKDLIYKIAQRELFYTYLSSLDSESLDNFFDYALGASISAKEIDLEKLIKLFPNLESSYFKESFSMEKLLNISKYDNIKEISFLSFSSEHLMSELFHFIEHGELSSTFINNISLYNDFIYFILKERLLTSVLHQKIEESIFPSSYFFSQSVIHEFFSSSEIEKIINTDKQKEIDLERQISLQNELPKYNLAVFKFLVKHNQLPSWAIYNSIADFQPVFIKSINQDPSLFLKELKLLLSEDYFSDNLLDFLELNLNKSNIKSTENERLLIEFIDLITTHWKLNYIDSNLYNKALDLCLIVKLDTNEEDYHGIFLQFFQYAIYRLRQSFKVDVDLKIDQLKKFIKKIKSELKINLLTSNDLRKIMTLSNIKEENLNEKELKNLDLINQKLSKQLEINQEILSDKIHWQPAMFLLLSSIEEEESSINQLKELISPFSDDTFNEKPLLTAKDKFRQQSLVLIFRILVKNKFYESQDFKDHQILINYDFINQKIVWLNEVVNQLKELQNNFKKQIDDNPQVLEDFKIIIKELFSKNEIKAHQKVLYQLYDLYLIGEIKSKENFILSFIHYLSHVHKKEVNDIILSLFRTNAIRNTNLYYGLLDLDDKQKLEYYKKDNYSTILAFELQQLLRFLDYKDLFQDSILYIVDYFKSIENKSWEYEILNFFISKYAIRKEISQILAFEEIAELLEKNRSLSRLFHTKKLFQSFEKSAYSYLEKDEYSDSLTEKKNIDELKQSTADLATNFIDTINADSAFLDKFISHREKEELNDLRDVLTFNNELDNIDLNYGEQITVYNAGLALIWPFLGTLFNKLGFIRDKQFINRGKQNRAIHLLQYIIDGGNQSPEFVLILNKLMCGIPISDPIDLSLRLSKEEKKEADQFLMSIKGKWKQMRNTSLDTFRESFLKREGILILDDKNWKLKVNHKSIDVLLKTLPWGISIIKFHWIDYIIFVEWTKKN